MNNETPLFQNGPFFKIGHAGGKELRWLVRYIAVAAKWIFRLRESFIPRTDPNRTRKAGRKEEGRETERNTCLQGWSERAREEDLATRGVVTGLNGAAAKARSHGRILLPPSVDAIRRGATARDRTSKSDFYLTSNAEQVIYRSEPNGGH